MKSIEWIDRLKIERNLPSDRQAALLLGMKEQVLNHHRKGRSITLDDKYAYKLEELLGLPHGKIVLDQHAEREKDPNVSAMWRRLATNVASFSVIFFQLGLCAKLVDLSAKNSDLIQQLTVHLR